MDRHDPRGEPGFSRRPSSSIFVANFVASFVVSERSLKMFEKHRGTETQSGMEVLMAKLPDFLIS